MGTAFSSIPDDNESARSPYFAPSASDCSTVSEKDSPYIVDWKKPQDPENSMHWAMRSRLVQILLVSIFMSNAAVASPALAPGVPGILRQFSAPEGVLTSLVMSIFNVWILRYPAYPISNRLHNSNPAYAVSHSFGVFLVFRFLRGCAGASPLSIGGGTIIWRSH
ncbi:uncharacterized protein BDZ83DRAFT_590385 [Colletotrichum acutatum]|uniref:Major facilitator superfamily transporter n=1 Tax=Glomerella acutata TaxID=27357 RepID=A0AAD8UEH3_GLOAC|nr:uncharacterized protein BDZ83DRAFT_590385 [Colletotrichum acutatum]KAK1711931.1 hypothetical protein BDZ83DRAFT_590385 [Colletotrichum acutatum]